MPAKTFTFKDEVFITAKTSCVCCGHKFRYSLTFAQLLFFDRRCSLCSPNVLDLPDKGMIDTDILDLDEWV